MHATAYARDLGVRELIRSDFQVWAEIYRGFKNVQLTGWRGQLIALHLLFAYGGFRATLLLRLAHAAHRRGIRCLPQFLANLNLMLHGFDMPAHVPIGPRFHLPHPVGTVITARGIGANVTLVSAVTIGTRKEHGYPLVGDDVYVGAGARLLGGITIGDRSQIGANAVVLRDVPSDSVAVGVPATARPARDLTVTTPSPEPAGSRRADVSAPPQPFVHSAASRN